MLSLTTPDAARAGSPFLRDSIKGTSARAPTHKTTRNGNLADRGEPAGRALRRLLRATTLIPRATHVQVLQTLLAGAREHNLSEEWLSRLEALR